MPVQQNSAARFVLSALAFFIVAILGQCLALNELLTFVHLAPGPDGVMRVPPACPSI